MTVAADPSGWFGARRDGLADNAAFLKTDRQTITYREIDEHTRRFAALADDLEIGQGEPVLVVSSDPDVVGYLALAVVLSGRCLGVIDPTGSAREIRAALVVVEPKLVFAGADVIERCGLRDDCVWTVVELAARREKTLAQRLLAKRQSTNDTTTWPGIVEAQAPVLTLPELDPEQTAVILFTSGSTSRPKGVELSFRALLTHFETLTKAFKFEQGAIHNVLPLSHTDGLLQGPLLTYFSGATWVRPTDFSVASIPALLDAVYRERVTHMLVVPTMLALYDRLGSDLIDAFDSDDFIAVVSSGGPLAPALWERFEQRFGVIVCNSYGLSETVSSSIISGLPDSGTRLVGSIGKPVDCTVQLLDDGGALVATGEVGEITIAGDHLFTRYRGDPDRSAAELSDGFFRTGDLASFDQAGFVHLQGRKDDLIIRGGLNVSPAEIDGQISELAGISLSRTVGVEDPVWGQRTESVVVADREVQPEDVIAYCREHLAGYKVPQRVVVIPEMPLMASGKIDADAIRMLLRSDHPTQLAGTGVEAVVLAAAARIFAVAPANLSMSSAVDEVDGWDSLAHLDLVGELEDRYGIEMSNRDILGIRTLHDAYDIVRTHLP